MTDQILNDEFYPELFSELKELLDFLPPNPADRIIILIPELIQRGLSTRSRMWRVAKALGFERRLFMVILHGDARGHPEGVRWTPNGEDRFRLLSNR